MNVLLLIYITVIIFGLIGIILLIFVQADHLKLAIFTIFGMFTLFVNAIFIMSLTENETQMRVAAYICGSITILVILLRIISQKTETFTKVMLVFSYLVAMIGAFFL